MTESDREWLARMRELARRDADELVPRPEFAVYGLAAPRLRPQALTDAGHSNGEWVTIELAYGDWAAAAGPWVVVTSRASDSQLDLLWAIDTERNRLSAQAGFDDDDPAGPPRYWQASLLADTAHVTAAAGQSGNLLAATAQLGGVNVTVVSRGVELAAIRLTPVADLEPHRRGQNELLGAMQRRQSAQPGPVLVPAVGMAAYRALVDDELGSHARMQAAVRAGRVPRHRAGEAAMTGALWRRAVGELADRARIGRQEADEIITSVVNQLTSLSERTTWFGTNARLRERAIGETLRHAVLGEHVSSAKAQQAWTGYWNYHTSLVVRGAQPALQSAARVGSGLLRQKWLDAWTEWSWSSR